MSAIFVEPAAAASLPNALGWPGYQAVVHGTSRDPNAKLTVLLFRGSAAPSVVVKIPTTLAAAAAVERERQALQAVHQFALGLVQDTIPRVAVEPCLHGSSALAMTGLRGQPMLTAYHHANHTGNERCVAGDFAVADAWLCMFQQATKGRGASSPLAASLASILKKRFAGRPGLASALSYLDYIAERLAPFPIPISAVHGDFWFGNILLEGERVAGVVDWEHADMAGGPLRDVVRFALSYALYLDRHTAPGVEVRGHRGFRAGPWGAGVAYAMEGDGWFPELFRGYLRSSLIRLGVPGDRWRQAALLGLAEIAASADDDDFAWNHLWLFLSLAERGR